MAVLQIGQAQLDFVMSPCYSSLASDGKSILQQMKVINAIFIHRQITSQLFLLFILIFLRYQLILTNRYKNTHITLISIDGHVKMKTLLGGHLELLIPNGIFELLEACYLYFI